MLTFREFYEICEGKKPGIPPHAVPGTYSEVDGVRTYTLQSATAPVGQKPTKKEIKKLVLDRSGGKAVKQELNRRQKELDKKNKK
jgi:hypothetical protein